MWPRPSPRREEEQPLSVAQHQERIDQAAQNLYPVTSFGDAAELLEAAAMVPSHVPSRSQKIMDKLSAIGSKLFGQRVKIEPLLSRLESQPAAQRVMEKLPPADGMALMTDRETCAVTGCKGLLFRATHNSRELAAHPTVYTRKGPIRAVLLSKRCTKCDAMHYLSYATGCARVAGSELDGEVLGC
jgi:hypothetical protein